ncbi:hypothetical protein CR513_33767, partial [Mucuna pruriens]
MIIGPTGVEGDALSQALSACLYAECAKKCKAQHSDGQGTCEFNVCPSFYNSGPPTSPDPPERESSDGLGHCWEDIYLKILRKNNFIGNLHQF